MKGLIGEKFTVITKVAKISTTVVTKKNNNENVRRLRANEHEFRNKKERLKRI